MYCSRCGGELVPGSAFCRACGTPVSVVTGGAGVMKRPAIITVLAALQFISAAGWLIGALGVMAAAFLNAGPSNTQNQSAALAVFALLLAAGGAAQLFCGIGLLKLKPYGRTLQLVFAWIGLLGFPIATLISILILIYLYKPGIKVLFSGRDVSDLSPVELAQVAEVTQGSAAATVLIVAVVVILVVAGTGIVAAIAVPGLLRARMSGNEASAIGSLRAINSGQAAYSASCAAGGYAVALEDLANPPGAGKVGFVSPDLRANGVVKSGYTLKLARDAAAGVTDVGTAAATCNASTRTPASSYFASADPVTPGATGSRHFATDSRGTIFSSASPIDNPIVLSPRVVPVQ